MTWESPGPTKSPRAQGYCHDGAVCSPYTLAARLVDRL